MLENIIKPSLEDKTVEVVITRKNGDQHSLLFDEQLWPVLKKFQWWVHETRHKSGKFYGATRFNDKLLLAHWLVLEPFLSEEFPECDHIGPAATLDNRCRNLRVVTRFEQMRNQVRNRLSHSVPTRPNFPFGID